MPSGSLGLQIDRHLLGLRVRLQLDNRKRDLAMFNLAINGKLRGCDLVRLQIGDVSINGRVRERATVVQRLVDLFNLN
jgi:hypothetical protein